MPCPYAQNNSDEYIENNQYNPQTNRRAVVRSRVNPTQSAPVLKKSFRQPNAAAPSVTTQRYASQNTAAQTRQASFTRPAPTAQPEIEYIYNDVIDDAGFSSGNPRVTVSQNNNRFSNTNQSRFSGANRQTNASNPFGAPPPCSPGYFENTVTNDCEPIVFVNSGDGAGPIENPIVSGSDFTFPAAPVNANGTFRKWVVGTYPGNTPTGEYDPGDTLTITAPINVTASYNCNTGFVSDPDQGCKADNSNCSCCDCLSDSMKTTLSSLVKNISGMHGSVNKLMTIFGDVVKDAIATSCDTDAYMPLLSVLVKFPETLQQEVCCITTALTGK